MGTRSHENIMYVVDKGTELGCLIDTYQSMDEEDQKRLLGYMQALIDVKK